MIVPARLVKFNRAFLFDRVFITAVATTVTGKPARRLDS
jgi:hypothetical protein